VPLVAEFLRVLTDRLKVQVVMSSHHTLMRDRADRAFLVADVGGKSRVTIL